MRFKELNLKPWSPPAKDDLTTAQGRLALFIRKLPGVFRRIITGLGATGYEDLDLFDLPKTKLAQLDQAHGDYARLVSAVSRELAQARRENRVAELHTWVLDAFRNVRLMSKPRRGGARTKWPENRVDAQLFVKVERIARRLAHGFETFKSLRKPGFKGSREEIQKVLVRQDYSPQEAQVITQLRTLLSAAKRMYAGQSRRKLGSVQAAYTRGRYILADPASSQS